MALSGHSKALTGARQRQALSADGNTAIVGVFADEGVWARHRCSPAATVTGHRTRS